MRAWNQIALGLAAAVLLAAALPAVGSATGAPPVNAAGASTGLSGSKSAKPLMAWHTNYVSAQAQASAERKPLLVNFSGSDWCGWCIKLQKEVFQKPEFIDYARTNLVLLTVDFPRSKPLAPAQVAANQALAAKYGVEGFPTLLLLDGQGNRLGTLGFAEGGPKAFIKELQKILTRSLHSRVDQGEAAPAAAKGGATPELSSRAARAPRGGLHLQGIVAKKGGRAARINDLILTAGQRATVRVASGEVSIRCMEIRESSVIVKVDGRKEPLELKLAQRL